MSAHAAPRADHASRLARLLLFAAVATWAVSVTVMLLAFLWPRDAKAPPRVTIGSSSLPSPSDEPRAFVIGDYKAYLVPVLEEDRLSMNAAYLALGRNNPNRCTVVWLDERRAVAVSGELFSGVYRDPCRGTIFDRYGRYVAGPGGAHLPRFIVEHQHEGDLRVSLPASRLAAAP